MTEAFIGVVSYTGSRFADAQGEDGLAHRLERALAAVGVRTQVHVNTENLLDESVLPVTEQLARRSPAEELRIERRWAGFLGQDADPRWWLRHGLRWAKQVGSRTRPANPAAVRRLLNIELSHIDLMRRACDASGEWALILEDDADTEDAADLAQGLGELFSSRAGFAYVNLSVSFTTAELGVSGLMEPVIGTAWQGTVPRALLRSRRPATNTVCAVAYRTEFLRRLLVALDRIPLTPVAPIDWKLNQALMDMVGRGEMAVDGCWWVDPAPILQRSMHQ